MPDLKWQVPSDDWRDGPPEEDDYRAWRGLLSGAVLAILFWGIVLGGIALLWWGR